jgi:hypothetical protein
MNFMYAAFCGIGKLIDVLSSPASSAVSYRPRKN